MIFLFYPYFIIIYNSSQEIPTVAADYEIFKEYEFESNLVYSYFVIYYSSTPACGCAVQSVEKTLEYESHLVYPYFIITVLALHVQLHLRFEYSS
jgi:hypothetical protein